MRRTVLIVVVPVIVVGALGLLGIRRIRQSTTGGNAPQTSQVQRGSLVATINTAGLVEAADAVDLTFQVSGQVKEVKVKEGDRVKAGQEMARLDATDAELQVAQAKLTLDSAQADLNLVKKGSTAEEIAAAKASLASAQESLKALQAGPSATDIEVARLKWEQAKDQLWSAQMRRDAACGNSKAGGSGCDEAKASVASAEMSAEIARLQSEQAQQGPSAKDLRAAEAQVAQAQMNLTKLTGAPSKEDIAAAEIKVKQAELSLQQAQVKLAQCSLTAPFEGTIAHLALKVGQMVGPSAAAATIAGAGGLQVAADLSEVDVAKVKVGQKAEVLLDALPDRTFKGLVTDVASGGTSTQGVVNFPLTIRLEEADPAIKPGMTANVSVVVDRRENVLLVPSRAIQVQGKQHLVRVVQEGQVIEVPVEIGLSGDNGTEILGDALREGDLVVANASAATTPARGMGGGLGAGGIMFRR